MIPPTAEPLQVMCTLGVFGPLSTRIGPAWEARTGSRLAVRYDPTGVLMATIAAGQRADVVVAIDTAVATLAGQGVTDPATTAEIARSSVGLAKRPGLPPVDISTEERLVATLLEARSIAFSRAGASGLFFAALIERLGIADAVRAKAIIIPNGFTAERLATGEADLAVQQMSELHAVPGTQVVGPFPDSCQERAVFVAAMFARSTQPDRSRDFIAALMTREAASAFADAGLEAPAR